MSEKEFDNNRSKDVEGAKLERPADKEMKVSEEAYPVHVIEKFSVSSLQDDKKAPLASLGMQQVKVNSPMGRDGKASPKKPDLEKDDLGKDETDED